jgi:outer membrane protein OmpA-like peptidoglycan-associated protein
MWFVGVAAAQTPLAGDLHGPTVPITDGLGSTPLFVQTGPRGPGGAFALGLGIEGFRGTSSVRYDDGTEDDLLQGGALTGADLRVGFSRRLELAAHLGVGLGLAPDQGGPLTQDAPPFGLAETQLAVPIGLVVPRADSGGQGPWLALVPAVTLPGTALALVSEGAPTAGMAAATGVATDRVLAAADLGARSQPGGLGGTARGALELGAATSLGIRPVGTWWVRAEARGWTWAGGDVGTLGAELFATTTVTAGPLELAAGGGRGVIGGLGAAELRGLLQVSYVRTPERAGVDLQRPPEPAGYRFEVRAPDGRPVAGAQVLVAGAPVGVTGPDGSVLLAEEPRWSQVVVRAPGFVESGVPRADGGVVPVELVFAPAPLSLAVTDPEGRPVPATATVVDADGRERPVTDGELLTPGRYDLVLAAPGFGTQRRVIDVVARAPIDPVQAVLLPEAGPATLSLTLLDPSGAPVDGARVLVDGVPVGTTDAGVLTLAALAAGPHTVEVVHDGFTTTTASGVQLTDGVVALPLTLQRVPGTVRVRVRGPDGHPVDDAAVRFIGPRRLPPMELGPEGTRTAVLGAGAWTVTITSPLYGVQQRDIDVPADRYDLLDVDFVLQADEGGGSELVVRVIDPDGAPVERVEVTVDDRDYGSTASGGSLALRGLTPGVRSVALRGEHLRELAPRDVTVSSGVHEELFTAAWQPGSVDVTVREVEGPATDARVRFVGDAPEPPRPVGPDGHVFASLAAGTWTVVVTSPTAGVQERDLTVAADSRTLHRVEFVLAPQEQGLSSLALRVVDPSERPVDGAKVSLDGVARGTTSNLGTLRLSDLDVGTRGLVVWTEPYEPNMRDVRLLEGEQELEVSLDWAVGATRVHVQRDGLPLKDAVVRFLGDHPHPPAPVDTEGDVLTRLEPGFWLVVATSPTGGVAEWDLEVKPKATLHEVDLDMSGSVATRTDLFVRVVDPYDQPVEHATVWIDGDQKAGETQQGGAVLARDLAPRIVSLRVEAPDFVPTEPIDVQLTPGTVEQLVRISWPRVPVSVRVVDERDEPVVASVQWVGPRDVPELQTDDAGAVTAELAPGKWRALARAADGRALAGEVSLAIDVGDAPQPRTLRLAPTRAVMAGAEVALGETVPFDFGKDTLRPDAGPIVDEIARLLDSQPGIVRLEVQGHTDNVGGVALNQALSQARADAVVRALVARGVAIEKLAAAGYGPTRPVGDNTTDEGRARNRRVQFVVTERAAD